MSFYEEDFKSLRRDTILQVKINLEGGVQGVEKHGKYGSCKVLTRIWVAISNTHKGLAFGDNEGYQKLEDLQQMQASLWGSIPKFLHDEYDAEVKALAKDWGFIPGREGTT